jgi:hypothetical protein
MQEIKLKVKSENLETLMIILNNLKSGLISDIQSTSISKRTTQYNPKTQTIIREEHSGTADKNGKYITPSAYKQRLKKN